MSTTITLNLPDNIAAWLTTPEGMARAQAAIIAEFAHDDAADTRTPKEKVIDAVRMQQRSQARRKRDELVASVREGSRA